MDELKKVYIVTSGEYSDYRVDCVFSTEEEAEAYTNRHNISRYDSYTWEEYIVDANTPVDRTGLVAFQVSYSMGQERLYFSYSPWYAFGEADRTSLPFEHVKHDDSLHMGTGAVSHRWETWVWAKDKQDALKIGADRIMPVLAEHQIEGVEHPVKEKGTPLLDAFMDKPERGDRTFTTFVNKITIGDYTREHLDGK